MKTLQDLFKKLSEFSPKPRPSRMKTLKDLFNEPLHWNSRLPNSLRYWRCESYPVSNCWLRINDFPDQPHWTLYFNGECLDFDDAPKIWVINYE